MDDVKDSEGVIVPEPRQTEPPKEGEAEEAPKWLNDWEARQREIVREEVRAGLSAYHADNPPGNQTVPTPPPPPDQSSDAAPADSSPPTPLPVPPKAEKKLPPENPPPPPPPKWGFSKTTRRRPK